MDFSNNVGPESNPLVATMSLSRWALCLPRLILKTRTKFSHCLARSFAVLRRSPETASAVFPLPLESLDSFRGGGPHLSKKRLWTLAKNRLLHVWTLVLDFMFLGRWPTASELRRSPTPEQLSVFRRLRTMVSACGDAQALFPVCPGRSGPELGAQLFQLESFCMSCPALASGYMESESIPAKPDPGLLSASDFPELLPYRSLDADRLKLVGEGRWPMESFLSGVLWLPFQEPAFLCHGLAVPPDGVPNFSAEDPVECLKLAKLWDVRGLLHLEASPLHENYFSRVFNAFKDAERDRQIGDRRLPNMCEYHVNGPSKFLPQGRQLTMLRIPRFTHGIRGSITDRRDFYHQACVTPERSRTNMLPFSYDVESFVGSSAHDCLVESCRARKSSHRDVIGDRLGKPIGKRSSCALPTRVYPCFRSLFQGDHLGVEFALRSHEVLLQEAGLLADETRIEGNKNFPVTCKWDALVIDDYFCLCSERLSTCPKNSFAWTSLTKAREVYEKHQLLGSPEKDGVASPAVKVAGAEIVSDSANVRRGFVPVAAPLAKRVGLSTVSLRAACLPGLTSGLVSRLAGNWVSVLQFRKVWSSLIDGLFLFGAKCQENEGHVHALPKQVSQELAMLSSIAPLVMTNIAVDYLDVCLASDASNRKGAIVEAGICPKLHEIMWLDSDLKSPYVQLDNPFRAALRQLGEFDEDEPFSGGDGFCAGPFKAPLLYFDFVEICGGAGKVTDAMSSFGFVCAPTLDLSDSRHYDLSSLALWDWIIHMIREGRFKAFLVEPPCTTFSPAAHPAVRSYREPLGFDRTLPKTLHGNVLAFRALVLMRVGRRYLCPCGLEQSRLSKMCWLSFWKSLLELDFAEAVIASCMFGSPHRKEFRFLCYLLDTGFLDVRCCGGHSHVRIQGSLTKPSATYVDGLALHVATAFRDALLKKRAEGNLEPETQGHETVLANDVMLSSKWSVVRAWFWKRLGHINVLETSAAVSNLVSVGQKRSSCRFCHFVDSAVCRGALSKGRSPSRALQPLMRRAGAVCVASDLYPGWFYCPTRLNTADDPTRDHPLRLPLRHSLIKAGIPLDLLRRLNLCGLRRFAANWIRLILLATYGLQPVAGSCVPQAAWSWTCFDFGWVPGLVFSQSGWTSGWWPFARDDELMPGVGFILGPLLVFCVLGVFRAVPPLFGSGGCSKRGPHKVRPRASNLRHVILAVAAFCVIPFWIPAAAAMPIAPASRADKDRMLHRAGNALLTTRAVRDQTRDKRKVYLDRFKAWLWQEKGISFRHLMETRPADPEKISGVLVDYGRELYAAGKAYGIFAETINAVAVERPLIIRQLNGAWDLAFCWLADEPHQHHPALPISIMAALVTAALTWGWAYEASVILTGWTGVLRIGEILAATRAELVLPCDSAPGTSFALLVIRQPKTRGRSAKHQAARIDQEDVVAFLTAMYAKADRSARLWPYSASTLRKRFTQLLTALQLPTKKDGDSRPFDLGSLRPGGATWLLHQTESPELVRRRGRWMSMRTCEIYLQEVLVTTYLEKLDKRARDRILLFAGGYAETLEQCVTFLEHGIPLASWFFLLRGAGDPMKTAGKSGSYGGFESFQPTNTG